MNGELSLYALSRNDSTNGEHLLRAFATAADHGSGEDLRSSLFSFVDQAMNVYRVADFKLTR